MPNEPVAEPGSDEPPLHLVPLEHLDALRSRAREAYERVVATILPLMPAGTEIHHVGATAIPGCLTKGDLDIVVRVEPGQFDAVDRQLAARFPRNTGSFRSDTFSSFEDPRAVPPLGIQLTVVDGPLDVFHRFAAALAANPHLVADYNDLKRRCEGAGMATYRAAKSDFIAEILRNHGATRIAD